MTGDAQEIEWQFDAVALRPVLRWLEEPAGWTGARRVEVVANGVELLQVDLYLETDDWRFQRAGYALRIRRLGRRRGGEAALERLARAPLGPSGLRNRCEISEPLAAPDLPALLRATGPVGERVRAVAGNKRLLPLFELRTRRRSFDLEAEGLPLGRLALAATSIRPNGGGSWSRLRRVEVEVPPPALQALEPFVRELRDTCALPAAGCSRFEAGLLASDLRPAAPQRFGAVQIDPQMTGGAIALAVLRRQFAVFLAKEPGTRLGEDIEELHDMRVANRRLRAALALFAEVLPATALKAREELGWIGRELGAVRDLDVQLEQLDGLVAGMEEADRGALEQLRSLLHDQRETARAAMLELLDSRRYEAFVSRFSRALRDERRPRFGPASLPARALAPALIESRLGSVRKAGGRIGPDSPASDYHGLRTRCKRLRYALEFLEDVYPGETRPLIKRVVAVQDLLGLHQDADVAISRLRSLAVSGCEGLDPGTIFAMGEIAERYRRTTIELRAGFPAAFARLSGKRSQAFLELLARERPVPPTSPGTARANGTPATRIAAIGRPHPNDVSTPAHVPGWNLNPEA